MKAFLSIKFNGNSQRAFIEDLTQVFAQMGFDLYCFVKDEEKWGEKEYTAHEMMDLAFKRIRESSLVVVDLNEKGVGVGIEAGYAAAFGIPLIVIAHPKADISVTLSGISQALFRYEQPNDLLKYMDDIHTLLKPAD